MKKTLLFIMTGLLSLMSFNGFSQDASLLVFDQILFYDGYAAVVNQPVPDGVIRQRNDLYSKKLSTAELQGFGSALTLNVKIKAACDNYDRIGSVNLALVPKDASTYVPADVQRLELGRLITPFMNKNRTPNEVSYTYNIDNIAALFKDPLLNSTYDFWMELEVFGVPYSAQTQVSGCSGRTDVFFGSLELVSNSTPFTSTNNFLLPLNFKKDFNNYKEGASDAIGQTVRTITFDLPSALTDANFYLITSNHGANNGGEEYNRRIHYVYLDDVQKLVYTPGETSCEPYRMYNTQSNGIYCYVDNTNHWNCSPMSDAEWQSFSNWCPGAKIPTRVISLGNMAAGQHSFKISVPTAVFNEAQGNIPVSLYLQGKTSSLGVVDINTSVCNLYPNPTNDMIQISSMEEVKHVKVYNVFGQKIYEGHGSMIDLSSAASGVYLVSIEFGNDKVLSQKIIKN